MSKCTTLGYPPCAPAWSTPSSSIPPENACMPNPDAIQISRITARAIVHLKSWLPARASSPPLAPAIPADSRLLTLAPGEWLLISDILPEQTLREHVHHLREQGIA